MVESLEESLEDLCGNFFAGIFRVNTSRFFKGFPGEITEGIFGGIPKGISFMNLRRKS